MTLFVNSVVDVQNAADAFLIDQFGTIHDGSTPYPGVLHALETLRNAGRKLIVLSNSGRRAAENEERLHAMGFPLGLFDACISSGEVAWCALRNNPPRYLQIPCRVLLFARDPSLNILEGFDVVLAERAQDADLVMIAGSEADRMDYQRILERMQPAIDRGIPAICTNPDFEMIVDGRLYPSAGRLAEDYRARGGSVRFYGKPYEDIYRAAFRLLPDTPRSRIMAIGDSIAHDIRGAARMGCQSLLVLTGILAGKSYDQVKVELRRLGYAPDFIARSFG